MPNNLIVSFAATENQITKLKEFCKDKQNSGYYIALAQSLRRDRMLCLTFFGNKPDIYFGIYSRKSKSIIPDQTITDDELQFALQMLNEKYIFNTTREQPIAGKEIVYAWIEYLNGKHNDITVTI